MKPPKTNQPQPFTPRADCAYVAFNKPYEVLTQFTQPENSDKTTLSAFNLPEKVYPVGRLDYDSEGMLILSDDPRLNHLLLSPENAHERTYWAQVENVPDREALIRLASGVTIEGKRTQPARVKLLEAEPDLPARQKPIRYRANIPTCWIELTLTEGRNRQVRKMTAAVGHPTLRLWRVQIGRLSLFDLQIAPGQWRALDGRQVQMLFKKH